MDGVVVKDQVGTARPEMRIYSMRWRTGSQCRTSIISLYLMTILGHTGRVSPIIEKFPGFKSIITTFPQYFGFHSIFWTSLRQFLVTQDRILPIRRAADRSTQSRQDNWIVGIPV